MGLPAGKVDAVLAQLGAKRRGVVSRLELLAAGLSPHQIAERVSSGALIAIHPGVYIVGHMATAPYALEAAALVACRPRVLLAGATSARIWKLPVAVRTEIELLAVGRHRRSLPGVTVRSIDNLAPGEQEGSAKITRSEAERIALRLMWSHGLDPESDVRIGPYRVDFLFRPEKLIVEVDGFRVHATPERFAKDRQRTAALMATGHAILPLSWVDLTEGSDQAMRRLLATLIERR